MKTTPLYITRGAALVTVILITTVLCVLVASILGLALTERRLNHRDELRLEARYAAEAAAEYGISQIRHKYATRSTIDVSPTGTDALKPPPTSFWNGARVDPTSVQVIGGTASTVTSATSSLYLIDRNDPANANDPDVGKKVHRRDVPVLAKATVIPPNGGPPITSYVLERLAVRAIPLFAHAIFYNMDMEIFPGPTMNIYGPVHVNGDMFCSSQGATLNFLDTVTVSGNIFHAWKNSDSRTHGTGSEPLGTLPVSFRNANGKPVQLYGEYNYIDEKGRPQTKIQWNDSSMGGSSKSTPSLIADAAFQDFATNTWNGWLQTSAHGIGVYPPAGVGAYIEDKNTSNGIDESQNSARQLIEPSNWPTSSDPDCAAKEGVEKAKYANDAGVYITVNPTDGTYTAVSRSKYSKTPTKTLTLPTGLISWSSYSTSTSKKGVTTVKGGMYDQRREKGINLVQIDMAKLKTAVSELEKDAGKRSATASISGLETSDWTGIVYVEIAGGPTTNIDKSSTTVYEEGTTNPATKTASLTTAVRLINGTGSVASYGTANPGLTVATNGPLYVKGNYNADGTIQDNTTEPDKSSANQAETGEVPAALVADAVTFLSENFDDSTSYSTKNPTATTSTTEVSAAVVMGNTPTDKNDSNRSSGGVHNFPRFLENWSGKEFWIRGSLVCLFESRVAAEPWSNSGFYSPPGRRWGFNSLFRDGILPPGTPKIMTFRRVAYTDLTAAQYNALKTSLGW